MKFFRRAVAIPVLMLLSLSPAGATTPPAPGVAIDPQTAEALRDMASRPFRGGFLALVHAAQRCSVLAAAGLKVDCQQAVTGERSIPVLAAKFKNRTAPYAVGELQTELFDGPWPTGTLTDFYTQISYGNLTLSGAVTGWYALQRNDDFYEGPAGCQGLRSGGACGTSRIPDLVADAVKAADEDLDFAQYDNDGPDGEPNSGDDDGFVDFVAIVHPEVGSECGGSATNNIWSHQSLVTSWGGAAVDTDDDAFAGGKIRVDNYTVQPALACDGATMIEVGVFCHEFGHAFGLPDLYDPDGSSAGVGRWDVMGSGCWGGDPAHATPDKPVQMGAWGKSALGWIKPTRIFGTPEPETVQIPNSTQNPFALKLFFGAPVEAREHFLVENRVKALNDASLPSAGLLIWHVKESRGGNTDECIDVPMQAPCSSFPKVALEQKDGLFNLEAGANRADAGDVFAQDDEFTGCTTPASHDYERKSLRTITIDNISAPGAAMSADVRYGEPWVELFPTPAGNYGHFVADIGEDLNDDGVNDFLRGLPGVGSAAVVSGKDGSVLRPMAGQGGLDRFGGAVAAGDIDGDGFPDIVVGAFEGSGEGPGAQIAGRVYAFKGDTGAPLFIAKGVRSGDQFGAAVAVLDDVGVLVGAPGFDIGGGVTAGRVSLLNASGSEIQHWDGEEDSDAFGSALAALDHGTRGFVVGAPLHPGDFQDPNAQRGRVYVYDQNFAVTATLDGPHAVSHFGDAVGWGGLAGPAGSRKPMVLIGAPDAYSGGSLFVYTTAGVFQYQRNGARVDGGQGSSVAGAADLTDDGGADFVVGARGGGASGKGAVLAFDGATGVLLKQIDNTFRSGFGLSVALSGDTDCDGAPNLIVGGQDFGKVYRTGAADRTEADKLQDTLDGLGDGSTVGDAVVDLRDQAGL